MLDMKRTSAVFMIDLLCISLLGGRAVPRGDEPDCVVLGNGKGAFTVGEQFYASSFNDPSKWQIQILRSIASIR